MTDVTALLMGDPPPGRRELIARCGCATEREVGDGALRREVCSRVGRKPYQRITGELEAVGELVIGGSLVMADRVGAQYVQYLMHKAGRGRFACRSLPGGASRITRIA